MSLQQEAKRAEPGGDTGILRKKRRALGFSLAPGAFLRFLAKRSGPAAGIPVLPHSRGRRAKKRRRFCCPPLCLWSLLNPFLGHHPAALAALGVAAGKPQHRIPGGIPRFAAALGHPHLDAAHRAPHSASPLSACRAGAAAGTASAPAALCGGFCPGAACPCASPAARLCRTASAWG